MKTWQKAIIGLGLAAAAAIVIKKVSKSATDRTIEAMTTPGTSEYNAIIAWNKANRPNETFEQILPGHIAHHTNLANPDAFIHKYK